MPPDAEALPAPDAAPAKSSPPASKRDQLIETATKLFFREGFRAIGIDRLLEETGIAKMTLYKHFRSKDDLVVAVLERVDAGLRAKLAAAVAAAPGPQHALPALIEAYCAWFLDPSFRGCLFSHACAEYGNPDGAIHAAAARHKQAMRDWLCHLAAAAGYVEPERLARQLAALIDGAAAQAHVLGDTAAVAQTLRETAQQLLVVRF